MRTRSADFVRLLLSLLIVGVLAIAAWKLGLFQAASASRLSDVAEQTAGAVWLPVIFIVIFAAVAALPLPITPLSVGAGVIFGFVRGSVVVWIATMLGAMLGYFLARGILAGTARRLIGRHREKLETLREGNVALSAFRMRMIPIVPFGLFNYAAAIGRVPPAPFLGGTAIGIIPGTLLAKFLGDRLIAGVHGDDRQPLLIAAAVALVLLMLSFLPRLVRKQTR